MPERLIRELYRLLKSFLVGGTCGYMVAHVEKWYMVAHVAEIKYSVCPCPFMMPREG